MTSHKIGNVFCTKVHKVQFVWVIPESLLGEYLKINNYDNYPK